MGTSVSVDAARLRQGASALAADVGEKRGPALSAGDLGSSRADAAFEGFERYWGAGRSALSQSGETLAGVLRSAAEAYTRRDADDARGFGVGSRAL